MKNKVLKTLSIFSLAGILSLNVFMALSDNSSDLELTSIIKLKDASAEHLGGEWYTNFSMGDFWYRSSTGVGTTTEPSFWVSAYYTKYRCCLNSCDANSCNFAEEATICASAVTRSAKQ